MAVAVTAFVLEINYATHDKERLSLNEDVRNSLLGGFVIDSSSASAVMFVGGLVALLALASLVSARVVVSPAHWDGYVLAMSTASDASFRYVILLGQMVEFATPECAEWAATKTVELNVPWL